MLEAHWPNLVKQVLAKVVMPGPVKTVFQLHNNTSVHLCTSLLSFCKSCLIEDEL